MQKSNNIYNASVEIVISSDESRVIRVYPDGYKMKYKAGQYGSLGLESQYDPDKIVKHESLVLYLIIAAKPAAPAGSARE